MKRIAALFLLIPVVLSGQPRSQPDAAHIRLKLQKLNFLGSVLYVAAHPDDENTRIITHMANDQLAATAYLSMTRGDGGQNLIGPEIRDELGLIRTHELLAARRIDGGEQFFTRANDFGYSKSADETFEIWGKQEILSDVVRVFRMFKPDVVLTRFPPNERAGHGHHTASAVLAGEAFDLARQRDVFPDQVQEFGIAEPVRLYTNTGRWWNNSITKDTPGVVVVDVGGYNPLLGASYSEIAAISRSQHKSQGFGSSGSRGEQLEFFEFMKGKKSENDLFEGINTTWSRVKGGGRIQGLVEKAVKDYRMDNPAASVPALLHIRKSIEQLDEGVWKKRKLREVNQLIQDCLGLYGAALADRYYAIPGENVTVTFEFVNRSTSPVRLVSLRSEQADFDSAFNASLDYNAEVTIRSHRKIDEAIDYSDPYWLREPHSGGMFTVNQPALIGRPDNPPAITFTATFNVAGEPLEVEMPLDYRWTDPVKGEQHRPVEVIPAVDLTISNGVWIFGDELPKELGVSVRTQRASGADGKVKLNVPEGWRYTPAEVPFKLESNLDEATVAFKVIPPDGASEGLLKAEAVVDNATYSRSLKSISYDHFPIQTLLPEASSRIVRLDIAREGEAIGYIEGAGDDIPSALRNMGYDVWMMKNEDVTPLSLAKLDAVVLGIRALSTRSGIEQLMKTLLAYVEGGGTLIVQYNNDVRLDSDIFAPYPLELSRDRVSEEDAEVRFLAPEHPVLNTPNRITASDFDHWVQERGLYFPSTWDKNYTAILSMNDKGEEPKDGSLLVAKYGKGYYIYTGLSFFRELPEGVPGAYRLFANMVSLGKHSKSTVTSKK